MTGTRYGSEGGGKTLVMPCIAKGKSPAKAIAAGGWPIHGSLHHAIRNDMTCVHRDGGNAAQRADGPLVTGATVNTG